MNDEQATDERRYCPKCGERSSSLVDSIFVEYGEWNEDAESYDSEGDVDVYRCADTVCAFEFADVTGIPDSGEKSDWVSVQTLARNPAPKRTEQGISRSCRASRERSDS